jgi:hypothetical protein
LKTQKSAARIIQREFASQGNFSAQPSPDQWHKKVAGLRRNRAAVFRLDGAFFRWQILARGKRVL